ncbi:MAG TPA: TIGR03986 family CRISPR-associated RAMP protein [Thioploca sp.]|nr:MAG: CRISPR-associated RAMP family protein [Beggiatoa sp. 4572_84]RKZ61568.1 MAG: TIGR03986 family CRISPR-associated RAMP protein [Gammaproteobacteria bacterium]HDN27048.1 TIGR03986 family CRISPR-associated RAMP protein [Thioploca sp.]
MSIYAPYNFVPLSAWIFKPKWAAQVSHDLPFSDGISGTLELTIQSHTPILVGGQQKSATKDHPGEIHFFQAPDERYAIPGTSIKGMIRNVLEIATFGKMRLVDDQWLSVRDLTKGGEFYRQHLAQPVGQNTYRPLACAGWLKLVSTEKNIHWQLTPCEYVRVEHNDLIDWGKQLDILKPERIKKKQSAVERYKYWKHLDIKFDIEGNKRWNHSRPNQTLYLEYAKTKRTLGTGSYEGRLVFTGQPADNTGEKGRKHLEFIFYNPTSTPKEVDEEVVRAFQRIHADSDEWKYWYDKLRKGESIPVFYLEKGNKVDSLGLAMMYRLPYKHSVGETINHTNSDHRAIDFYDFPELLFGTMNEEDTKFSIKSRISFNMAFLENQPQVKKLPPTILGGPKASYYPSYVQQKNAPQITGQQAYMTYMDANAEVRGWKRYPTNSRWEVPKADPALSNKVKVYLYPLAKGALFKCYLNLHNLRPAELGALIWALTWGDNPSLRHGLGMAKPFGFGQISLHLKDDSWQNLRSTNPNGTVPNRDTCLQAFVDLMEEAWAKAQRTGPKKDAQVKWVESEQMTQLLAMADPEKTPGQVDKLAYMPLPQFQKQKNSHWVLPPYVNYNGPSDPELFKRLTDTERWQLAEKALQQEEADKKAAEMTQKLAGFSSDLEKELYRDLFLAPNQSIAEAKATEWIGKMEQHKGEEAQKMAGTLKKFYTDIGKWKGGNKKQKAKIGRIKKVLGE